MSSPVIHLMIYLKIVEHFKMYEKKIAGKRSRSPLSSKGKEKEQPPFENQDSSKKHADLQGEAMKCILEDIQHDCDIASALQFQVAELIKSIDMKNKFLN